MKLLIANQSADQSYTMERIIGNRDTILAVTSVHIEDLPLAPLIFTATYISRK
jgi:hypothetical protein